MVYRDSVVTVKYLINTCTCMYDHQYLNNTPKPVSPLAQI